MARDFVLELCGQIADKYCFIYDDRLRRTKQKKSDITRKTSTVLDLWGVLESLGRRFESCRPDHLKTKSY